MMSMSPFTSLVPHISLLASALLCAVILGGGVYECLVIDPAWPKRPDLIQPVRGGITRGRFWFPLHTIFEIALIVCLVQSWKFPNIRLWLLLALASHVTGRMWSAFDFIPKALAFEKATTVDEASARSWTSRSRFRIPLELVTLILLLCALGTALRGE
jgi:hypothetical protein